MEEAGVRTMGPAVIASLCLVSLARAQEGATREDVEHLRGEVRDLQSSVQGMNKDLTKELGSVRDRLSLLIATTFLAGPPASSDVVGVARVAVFAPYIDVDTQRERDAVHFRVRRVEAGGQRVVGPDVTLPSGQLNVGLPVDVSGSLYVVEWWTSEGYTFTVRLRDGASDLTTATVQIRPLQNRGRFLYVAYKLE
jgi:hypothetical protein